jgi:hypothetical protein
MVVFLLLFFCRSPQISNSKKPHTLFPKVQGYSGKILSLSRVRPNSEYGTGKERGDGSVWGYVARSGRDSYQGMHGAAQKAFEPGKTVAQNFFTETNRFLFPTWTVWRSLFFWGFFLFPFLTAFFFFSFLFYLTHHRTGMGRPRGDYATDVRTRWQMDEKRR